MISQREFHSKQARKIFLSCRDKFRGNLNFLARSHSRAWMHTHTLMCLCALLCLTEQIRGVSGSETPWTLTRQVPLPMDFTSKNTGVGCRALLQGIFLTQESNPQLLPWQVDYLPFEPSIYLSIYLYLSVYLSVYIYLSIYLSI